MVSCQKHEEKNEDSAQTIMAEGNLASNDAMEITEVPQSEEVSEGEEDSGSNENVTFETQQLYELLNVEEMYEQLYMAPTDAIHEQALEMDQNDVYVEVAYDCAYIPQELILAVEEYLCKISKSGDGSYFYASDEFEVLGARFGSDELALSLEQIYEAFPAVYERRGEIEDIYDAYEILAQEQGIFDCSGVYCYLQDGQEQYVFVCPSDGYCMVRLGKRMDGEVIVTDEFNTRNTGYGRVIVYQDDYYYMYMQYNENFQCYDGVQIHHLGESPKTETITVRYVPKRYGWTTIYENEECTETAVWEYLYQMQVELLNDEYLEMGAGSGGLTIYIGDEELVPDFPEELVNVGGVYVYQIDMTNNDIPIYVKKRRIGPGDCVRSLVMHYYVECSGEEGFQEMEVLSTFGYGGVGQDELIQMWFKEIDGTVYTFQVYHIDHYSYLLNALLIQEDQVTVIGQTIATPTREFELIEEAAS